ADRVTGIEPTGSSFIFSVGCAGTGAEVVPVVYAGSTLDGLETATTTDALRPTNAHGFGGGVTVVAEATATEFGPVAVDAIDLAADSFTSNGTTYFWDSGDTFRIGGMDVTMEQFEAAITTGDDLLAGSVYDPGGISIFELQDDSPLAPGLSLSAVTHDSVTLTYVAAEASDHIEIHSCIGAGCDTTLARSVVNGTDDDPSTTGTQLVISGLTATTEYDFQAVQIEGSDASPKSEVVRVTTPVALSITLLSVEEQNDGSGDWSWLTMNFDQNVAFDPDVQLSDFHIHTVDQPSIKISPSKLLVPTDTTQLGLYFSPQTDTDPDTEWVLTIAAGALDVGTGGDPNGELTATFSH
ncbi:MAG: hypothetical protein R3324_08085, partial [Halobacteriales archaeon]|nr:hypothetical protein [Halobacteriales archaeon]